MLTSKELELKAAAWEIARFEALRQLGKSVISLEAERNRILEAIGNLNVGRFETYEGIGIVIHPKDEDSHLIAEYCAFRDWGESAHQLYHSCKPGHDLFDSNVSTSYEHSETFVGNSMDYDPNTGQLWVYNDSHTFRVLVDDNMTIYTTMTEVCAD